MRSTEEGNCPGGGELCGSADNLVIPGQDISIFLYSGSYFYIMVKARDETKFVWFNWCASSVDFPLFPTYLLIPALASASQRLLP